MKLENNNSDFEKGIENGLDQIEKSSYESYVSNEVNLRWLVENKETLEKELNENVFQISESKNKSLELQGQKHEIKNSFDNYQYQIDMLENEVETNRARIISIHEKKDVEKTPYPFLAGLIYLAAGITFILGDLIISHEIVAYALNIRNNTEAWAFACGLAGVSILMKPAYERLVEQPYLTNFNLSTKKLHNIFQIALVVISIGTLAILGWFRYEAYKTDRLKEAINREIKSLQAEATPLITNGPVIENPALTQRIEEKLKAYDALNQKLVNSPWALLSFVMSGLLFAIAGAVCLGIAFPSIQVYWKRWFQYNPAINKSKRIIRKRNKLLATLKQPWFEADNQIKLIDQKLSFLPDFKSLENRNQTIKDEVLQLNEKIKFEIESARVNNYTEGYDTGQQNRNSMDESEIAEFRKNLLDKLKYRHDELSEKTPRTYRSNGLRPHQALRKAISDEFNEN